MNRDRLLGPAAIFTLGLTVRVALIHLHPIVFGGDSVVRLMNRDRILLSYQLPLLQALLHAVSLVTDDLLAYRYLMAVIGALAGVGFLAVAGCILSRDAALVAALLFASNPFLIELSIVPYQEVLSLAGLFFAFRYLFGEETAKASVCFGLACLTRYEAWTAGPLLVWAYWSRTGRSTPAAVRAMLLFGWAPAAWMVFHQGISPGGTFVVEAPLSAARLFRYVYLGWITLKNGPEGTACAGLVPGGELGCAME